EPDWSEPRHLRFQRATAIHLSHGGVAGRAAVVQLHRGGLFAHGLKRDDSRAGSFVTLGVEDLEGTTRFYQALGWPLSSGSVAGDVSFFRTASSRSSCQPPTSSPGCAETRLRSTWFESMASTMKTTGWSDSSRPRGGRTSWSSRGDTGRFRSWRWDIGRIRELAPGRDPLS